MELNYVSQGAGEPVVLMHGMFGSLSNLGQAARALSENYQTLSVDLRNHGDSPHSPTMTYPAMAADVEKLINTLGLPPVHLLGHSMGGKVAMQLALMNSKLVKSVVVADISPVTYGARHEGVLEGLEALQAAHLNSRREAQEVLSEYVEEPGVRSFLLKNLKAENDGSYRLKLNLKAIQTNYFDELTKAPTGEAFHGPVLFVKGENSEYIQRDHKDTILNLFPKATLKVLANTGHWLHAERPGAFNQVVLEFLENAVL